MDGTLEGISLGNEWQWTSIYNKGFHNSSAKVQASNISLFWIHAIIYIKIGKELRVPANVIHGVRKELSFTPLPPSVVKGIQFPTYSVSA